MGVDWIPCRVEPDCPKDELCRLVNLEAVHFRAGGSSLTMQLDPSLRLSEAEREVIHEAYAEHGPLHRRLLFKRDSHRIAVVCSEVLFPVEWRIDAERTIPPWELDDQLAGWESYREEVRQGRHEVFVRQLYHFDCINRLVTIDLANLVAVASHSLTAAGRWATLPEVSASRREILAAPILTLPAPPRWPSGGGALDPAGAELAFAKVESAVIAWNRAVERGNYRLGVPRRPLPFDQWVADRLDDGWFPSFIAWVEPWRRGGYGLYRDCE